MECYQRRTRSVISFLFPPYKCPNVTQWKDLLALMDKDA